MTTLKNVFKTFNGFSFSPIPDKNIIRNILGTTFGLTCNLYSKFLSFQGPLKMFLCLSRTELIVSVVSLVALANCCYI